MSVVINMNLKSSVEIVLIQATGLIVSLFSVYFVAGDMGPELYSLRGIQTIVMGVVLVFSHLGIETTMMREALYWKEKGEEDKVKEYATQSILSRFLGFAILTPFVLGYLAILCFNKYSGQYLFLFLLYYIGSCISAINNSMALIVRSQGGYVFSQLVTTLNSDIIGAVAIILYMLYGADVYLPFMALSSLPVFFIFISRIKNLFSFKYVSFSSMMKKIRDSKFLWLKSYLDYFKGNADSLLVSLLFPPVIIGSYTIYKTLENMGKSFIEGFFDVLSQRTVRYKGDFENLCREEKKYNYVRISVMVLLVTIGIVFSINPDFYITLVNLQKYESMRYIIYTVLLVSIIYLAGKYEINAVSLFAPSKTTFKVGVATFIISVLTYLSLVFIPTIDGALLQRVLAWSGVSLVSILLFRKNRSGYYSIIYK